jgi:hypothetical protein
VLADRVDEVAEPGTEALDRRQVRIGLDPVTKPLDQRLEAGDVEPLLAAEVLEDQAVRDPGGVGDLVDRDLVVVPVAKDLERSADQLEPALSGALGCQGPRSDGSA